MKVITLGNGDRVTLGAYARGIKACKASPPGTEFSHGLQGWTSATREEILKEFMYGVHDRINRHIPSYRIGRKWGQDWQREASNAARVLNTPRLVIRWLPAWLKPRFADRITTGEY